MHTHTHTRAHSETMWTRSAPSGHILGMWEETRVPAEDRRRHGRTRILHAHTVVLEGYQFSLSLQHHSKNTLNEMTILEDLL